MNEEDEEDEEEDEEDNMLFLYQDEKDDQYKGDPKRNKEGSHLLKYLKNNDNIKIQTDSFLVTICTGSLNR